MTPGLIQIHFTSTHTHIHTHTQRDREKEGERGRERKRDAGRGKERERRERERACDWDALTSIANVHVFYRRLSRGQKCGNPAMSHGFGDLRFYPPAMSHN